MIQEVKTLYKTLGKTHLSVVMDIERNLNNRPLTYVESNHGKKDILTLVILWGQIAYTRLHLLQSHSQSMPVRCHYITREQAYSGNEIAFAADKRLQCAFKYIQLYLLHLLQTEVAVCIQIYRTIFATLLHLLQTEIVVCIQTYRTIFATLLHLLQTEVVVCIQIYRTIFATLLHLLQTEIVVCIQTYRTIFATLLHLLHTEVVVCIYIFATLLHLLQTEVVVRIQQQQQQIFIYLHINSYTKF